MKRGRGFTISEKIALLDKIKSYATNTCKTKIAQDLKISRAKLSNLLKNEQNLRVKLQNNKTSTRKRERIVS